MIITFASQSHGVKVQSFRVVKIRGYMLEMGKGVFDRKNEFTQFFMQTVPVLCHAETGFFYSTGAGHFKYLSVFSVSPCEKMIIFVHL